MKFNAKLRQAMRELEISQAEMAAATGKSEASISQYLSGKQVPPEGAQREIAAALGLDEDYFTQDGDEPAGIHRMTVQDAARLLHASIATVAMGLQQRVFPWGYAIRTGEHRWAYIINADRFEAVEGVNAKAVTGKITMEEKEDERSA
ncbi:MAG: helix-turn-helix domain-containing protein [Clostridiales bacterium]|nr:helix-turn-helix domain-containing protein [Clostridiales bacterium]